MRARARGRGRGRRRRIRPLTLSKLIGPKSLKPPPPDLAPPAGLLALSTRPVPRRAGAAGTATLADAEAFDPAKAGSDRRRKAHWDGAVWHDGRVRGEARERRWLWLLRDRSRWWGLAGRDPLLRRGGLWWVRRKGLWFAVHDGQAWAWRSFQDWDAGGLYQPDTGMAMVYSRDFRRVALVTPGRGAEVFDARDGRLLARVPQNAMPRRRGPRVVPAALVPPWRGERRARAR
jgi:hypothetical protein